MKDRSMFPFRRGTNKKRGKGGGGNPGGHNGGHGGGNGQRRQHGNPRRIPGSAGELLPLLQPTTKALAQVLAGNSKASGQIVHARNILDQAQRLIDDRQIDRLAPAHREEFLEQLARLKLTLADAEDDQFEEEVVEAPPPRQVVALSPERLRELALSLAAPEPAAAPAAPAYEMVEPDPEPSPMTRPVMVEEDVERADIKAGSPRSARLRLRTETRDS